MKPSKQSQFKRLSVSTTCSQCGRQFATDFCPACQANLMVALHLRLERAQEEKRKQLWLSKLRFALAGASRYLPGFDTTPIQQAINEAQLVRAVKADDKEKDNATETS